MPHPGTAGCPDVEVIVADELGPWAEAWDELVLALPVPTPFLRSWWLAAVCGPRARFLLVVDGAQLAGGLALEECRRIAGAPLYRVAGWGKLCPDHLDVLRRAERADEVAAALRDWGRRGAWALDATGVVDDALLARVFPGARATPIDVAPWDELPATGEEYLARRSASQRRELRRAQRRMEQVGIVHRRVGLTEAPTMLDEFERLHRARGDREPLLREMPRLRPALLAGIARGEVQVDVLAGPQRVVAIELSFQLAGALLLYQTARSLDAEANGSGVLLAYHLARQGCAAGCRELDLLRGAEPYKDRLVSRRRTVWRVRAAHGVRGRAVLAALEAGQRGRQLAGRLRRAQLSARSHLRRLRERA
jgi:hypothetical protein